jgi:hypothetical protein
MAGLFITSAILIMRKTSSGGDLGRFRKNGKKECSKRDG